MNFDPSEPNIEWLPAPSAEPTVAETVEDALIEAGVPLINVAASAERLDALVQCLAIKRAAEYVRHLIRSLPGSAAAVALERVVLGDKEPARESAERVGVSHTAVLKQTAKLTSKLAL